MEPDGGHPAPPDTRPPPPPPPPPPSSAAGEPGEQGDQQEHHKRSFWRELPVLVVIAFVVALLIKSFLLQAFYIPSGSMESTLGVGDRVLVEKVTYRFSSPGRGDVVVFERDFSASIPQDESDPSVITKIGDAFKGLFGFPTAGVQDFIKRVIAIEGDTIEGRDGVVFVNGKQIDEPYLDEGVETSSFGPVSIPDGMMFVMGDNRPNSDDSRSFGPVPVDKVVGHAFLLIWPPSNFGGL